MIPAAFIGFFFKNEIETIFSGNILLVGAMLLVTALLLFMADKAKDTKKDVGFIDAVIIGIAQGIAILPGISRSGATISTSVLLGNDRSKAAEFSFLMVIPLIFGAMAKDLLDGVDQINFTTDDMINMSAGFIAAFVFGVIACKWMIALVKKAQLKYFALYCLIVGLIAIGHELFF
jgi:undecaprenyl-diphosphatase